MFQIQNKNITTLCPSGFILKNPAWEVDFRPELNLHVLIEITWGALQRSKF